MKVVDISQKNLLQNVTQAHSPPLAEKPQKPGEVEGKTSSGDRVEFSARSKEMQKIYEILQASPDVRSEKVADLKRRIEEGRYRVDSEGVAEKIIRESLLDVME